MKHSFGKGESKLSHLLLMGDLKRYGGSQPYIDSLLKTAHTVKNDIGMRFGIDKCGIMAIRRSKQSECESITTGSGEVIDEIDNNSYNIMMPNIMERSDVCLEEMKTNVNTEYFKLVVSALKSKRNA